RGQRRGDEVRGGDDDVLQRLVPGARLRILPRAPLLAAPTSLFDRGAQPAADVRDFHQVIVLHAASRRSLSIVNSQLRNSQRPSAQRPAPCARLRVGTSLLTFPVRLASLGSFGRWELGVAWALGVAELWS